MTIPDYRSASDASNMIMVQIADESAPGHLDAIAAIAEVDLLFVRPAYLSQSIGVASPFPQLDAAIDRITAAEQRHGKAVGLFVGDPSHIARWAEKGVTLFVCGSDQVMLRRTAPGMMASTRG